MTCLLLFAASALSAQSHSTSEPRVYLVPQRAAGMLAIIDAQTAQGRTPLDAVLPNQCGSFGDCDLLTGLAEPQRARLAAHARPRVWVIEVQPSPGARNAGYDPKDPYGFTVLDISPCGAGGLCPDILSGTAQPTPTPTPTPPDCGVIAACPDPGPGPVLAFQIDRGTLVAKRRIALTRRQIDYIRDLLSRAATEKEQEDISPR